MGICVETGGEPMEHNSTRILVLYWHPDPFEEMRVAIRDHLGVLENSSIRHEILYYNAVDGAPSWICHCRPDAVLLHTTFLCLRWSHLFYEWKWKLRWVRDLDCVKIALPQDEYDHSEILDEWLFEWGVSIIFSNFDEPNESFSTRSYTIRRPSTNASPATSTNRPPHGLNTLFQSCRGRMISSTGQRICRIGSRAMDN